MNNTIIKITRIISPIIIIVLLIIIGLLIQLNYKVQDQQLDLNKVEINDTVIVRDTVTITKTITQIDEPYFKLGDVNITSAELIRYVNDLNKELRGLEDSLSHYKLYYKMSTSVHNDEYTIVENEKGKKIAQLRSIELDTNTVNATINKRNKYLLDQELNARIYKETLDKYGIIVNIFDGGNNTVGYSAVAPKLDSALILLEMYRKDLKYNVKKGVWEVKVKRFF